MERRTEALDERAAGVEQRVRRQGTLEISVVDENSRAAEHPVSCKIPPFGPG